jgi:hypothetical protein
MSEPGRFGAWSAPGGAGTLCDGGAGAQTRGEPHSVLGMLRQGCACAENKRRGISCRGWLLRPATPVNPRQPMLSKFAWCYCGASAMGWTLATCSSSRELPCSLAICQAGC